MCATTFLGYFLIVYRVYRYSAVTIFGCDTWVDLVVLEIVNFNLIIGIDLLSPYHAVLDSFQDYFICYTSYPLDYVKGHLYTYEESGYIVCTRKKVRKGCLDYLALYLCY